MKSVRKAPKAKPVRLEQPEHRVRRAFRVSKEFRANPAGYRIVAAIGKAMKEKKQNADLS